MYAVLPQQFRLSPATRSRASVRMYHTYGLGKVLTKFERIFFLVWSAWSEWTDCTVYCDGANQTRSVSCQEMNANDGTVGPAGSNGCGDQLEDQRQVCNDIPCLPEEPLPSGITAVANTVYGVLVTCNGPCEDATMTVTTGATGLTLMAIIQDASVADGSGTDHCDDSGLTATCPDPTPSDTFAATVSLGGTVPDPAETFDFTDVSATNMIGRSALVIT